MRKFTTLAAVAAVSLALPACGDPKPAENAADANMTEEVPANDAAMSNDAAMNAGNAAETNMTDENGSSSAGSSHGGNATGDNATEGDAPSSGGQGPG